VLPNLRRCVVFTKKTGEPSVVKGIGGFFGRTVIGVVGVGLMILGVAMGVTMVMLPVGIGIGLAGAALVAGSLMARPEPR
jgi:hypothetical protein